MDASSLEVCFPGADVDMRWWNGFYHEEKGAELSWRWCSDHGVLAFLNRSGRPIIGRLFMILGGSENEVTVDDGQHEENIRVHQEGTPYSRVMRLEPGLACLHFAAHGSKVPAPADPRVMYFYVREFSFQEE